MLGNAPQPAPALPSNRRFGAVIGCALALLALYAAWNGHSTRATICAGLAAAFWLTALAAPSVLTPFNRLWMAFGLLLGKIVSPIVLGVIFLLLITPVALATRMFGRDALRLKKRAVSSHWIEREPAGPEPTSFQRQF